MQARRPVDTSKRHAWWRTQCFNLAHRTSSGEIYPCTQSGTHAMRHARSHVLNICLIRVVLIAGCSTCSWLFCSRTWMHGLMMRLRTKPSSLRTVGAHFFVCVRVPSVNYHAHILSRPLFLTWHAPHTSTMPGLTLLPHSFRHTLPADMLQHMVQEGFERASGCTTGSQEVPGGVQPTPPHAPMGQSWVPAAITKALDVGRRTLFPQPSSDEQKLSTLTHTFYRRAPPGVGGNGQKVGCCVLVFIGPSLLFNL